MLWHPAGAPPRAVGPQALPGSRPRAPDPEALSVPVSAPAGPRADAAGVRPGDGEVILGRAETSVAGAPHARPAASPLSGNAQHPTHDADINKKLQKRVTEPKTPRACTSPWISGPRGLGAGPQCQTAPPNPWPAFPVKWAGATGHPGGKRARVGRAGARNVALAGQREEAPWWQATAGHPQTHVTVGRLTPQGPPAGQAAPRTLRGRGPAERVWDAEQGSETLSHAVTPPGSPSPRPGPAPSSSHMGPRFTDGETEARRKPARPSPSAPLEGLPAPMHQANKRLRARRPQTPTCSPAPAVTKLRVPTAIWDPGPPKPRHRSPRSRPDTGSGMPQVWALRPAAGTLLGSPGAPCRRARAAREPAGRGSRPRHSERRCGSAGGFEEQDTRGQTTALPRPSRPGPVTGRRQGSHGGVTGRDSGPGTPTGGSRCQTPGRGQEQGTCPVVAGSLRGPPKPASREGHPPGKLALGDTKQAARRQLGAHHQDGR